MLHHALRAMPRKRRIIFLGYTDSGSATFDLPSGLRQNDVVVVASSSDSTSLSSTPSGYTAGQSGSNGVSARWAFKRMGATPDTQVTLPESLTDGRHLALAFRYVNTSTALDATSPTPATGNSGMPNSPSVTTATLDALVLALGFLDDDVVAAAVAAPTYYTLAAAVQGGASGAGSTLMAAYRHKLLAGSEDPGGFTASGGSDAWLAATVVLRPA